jgi:ketosteroid isomerase-like protein
MRTSNLPPLLAIMFSSFVLVSNAWALSNDEQQVLAVDQQWADAELKHDEPTIRAILDDGFVFTGEDGKTVDKARFLDEMRNSSMTPQTLAPDIVHIHGDTAVIVGTDTVQFDASGKQRTVALRYTVIYIKRHHQWRAVAEQVGRLALSK